MGIPTGVTMRVVVAPPQGPLRVDMTGQLVERLDGGSFLVEVKGIEYVFKSNEVEEVAA